MIGGKRLQDRKNFQKNRIDLLPRIVVEEKKSIAAVVGAHAQRTPSVYAWCRQRPLRSAWNFKDVAFSESYPGYLFPSLFSPQSSGIGFSNTVFVERAARFSGSMDVDHQWSSLRRVVPASSWRRQKVDRGLHTIPTRDLRSPIAPRQHRTGRPVRLSAHFTAYADLQTRIHIPSH